MRGLAGFILLALASQPAWAQSAPFKLVIIWSGGNIAVTDYPSRARCDAGAAAILDYVRRFNANIRTEVLPGGGTVTTLPLRAEAFCIPG